MTGIYQLNNFKKYLKETDNLSSLIKWLEENDVGDCHIHRDTLIVDVDGDLILRSPEITSLPCQFGSVHGVVDFSGTRLTSLIGFPRFVEFYCELDNLPITSLQGTEQSLIGGYFSAQECNINTLKFFPKCVNDNDSAIYLAQNPFTSLKDIHLTGQMRGRDFNISTSKIESHILGLVLVNCGTVISNEQHPEKWVLLVNNFLRINKDNKDRRRLTIELQNILLDEGYDKLAQL